MPSLREILEKQRLEKEKANGVKQPVLQSQAKPEIAVSPKTSAAESKLPTAAQSEAVTGTGRITAENSVVEQGPPAGLSGLALARWKTSHAKIHVGAVHGTNKIEPAGQINNTVISEERPINNNIASRPLTLAEKIKAKANGNSQSNPNTQNNLPPRTGEVISPTSQAAPRPSENSAVNSSDQKPTRTIDTAALRANLKYLADNIEQKELVGQIVRTIAVQLKQNPELTPLMTDGDVDLMVRGLRRSFAIVARKKSEDREKKAGKDKGTNELMAAFRDAGLGDLGLKL